MLRAAFCVIITLAFARGLAAQSPRPGVVREEPDPRVQIVRLLESPNAREQAWGAWFSTINVMPEMTARLQQSQRAFGE